MIVITKKDIELIETIKNLKVMTSSQIQRLFFYHQQNQSRRCKQLVNHKKIKCFKQGLGEENVYYYKRRPTQQLKSMLLVSEFYVRLSELGKELDFTIEKFTREYKVEITPDFTLRPDAYFIIKKNNIEYDFYLEIDYTKDFSGEKYFKARKLGYLFPPVISVSNRKRAVMCDMELLKIKLDLSNFHEIMYSYL